MGELTALLPILTAVATIAGTLGGVLAMLKAREARAREERAEILSKLVAIEGTQGVNAVAVARLEERVEHYEEELDRVRERQHFINNLLTKGRKE